MKILPERLDIFVQQPRMLVVRLKAPGLHEILAVARAPHSRASDEAGAAWWDHMSKHTRTYGIDHFAIDANGATGNRASNSVGD